jgi:hypothetical protein
LICNFVKPFWFKVPAKVLNIQVTVYVVEVVSHSLIFSHHWSFPRAKRYIPAATAVASLATSGSIEETVPHL